MSFSSSSIPPPPPPPPASATTEISNRAIPQRSIETPSPPRQAVKSSQNGGAMEGWNDLPALGSLLKNSTSSSSLSSKNRRRRVASHTLAALASTGSQENVPEMNRSSSQLSIGSGNSIITPSSSATTRLPIPSPNPPPK